MSKNLTNVPALADSFADEKTHPLHQMLARVADEIGLEDLLCDWATENPAAFTRMMLALVPNDVQKLQSAGGGVSKRAEGGAERFHLHLHPSLAPGPLDIEGEVVSGEG